MLSHRAAVVALLAVAACTTRQARRPDTTAPATATLAGSPMTDAGAVRQALEAVNARFDSAALKGDTAALASFYADSAILMFANAPAARGHEAVAKGFAALAASMKLTTFKLTTQDVIVSGDYAVETGAYELGGTPAKAGKPVHDVGKYLVLWKKQSDGSYKILRDISNSDLPAK